MRSEVSTDTRSMKHATGIIVAQARGKFEQHMADLGIDTDRDPQSEQYRNADARRLWPVFCEGYLEGYGA